MLAPIDLVQYRQFQPLSLAGLGRQSAACVASKRTWLIAGRDPRLFDFPGDTRGYHMPNMTPARMAFSCDLVFGTFLV